MKKLFGSVEIRIQNTTIFYDQEEKLNLYNNFSIRIQNSQNTLKTLPKNET